MFENLADARKERLDPESNLMVVKTFLISKSI
jgi:hypothetical protein